MAFGAAAAVAAAAEVDAPAPELLLVAAAAPAAFLGAKRDAFMSSKDSSGPLGLEGAFLALARPSSCHNRCKNIGRWYLVPSGGGTCTVACALASKRCMEGCAT